jgi:hypothetical protein
MVDKNASKFNNLLEANFVFDLFKRNLEAINISVIKYFIPTNGHISKNKDVKNIKLT